MAGRASPIRASGRAAPARRSIPQPRLQVPLQKNVGRNPHLRRGMN